MATIAGHAKAIRIAGRRMSQSGTGPIKSPSSGKGPSPSTSPEDHLDDRTSTDYPRPNGPHSNEAENEDQQQQNDEDPRQRKKEEQNRRRGMNSEEARFKKMESASGAGKNSQTSRTSNPNGMRINQPAGKMLQ